VDRLLPQFAILWKEAFNLRMGTNNLNTEEIFILLEKRNMTFADILTITEKDNYVYPSIPSPGRSFVCDVFVMSIYKAAGVFGDLTNKFEASELTPKDSYQLKIYDDNWKMWPQCQKGFKYCQLNGKYMQYLIGFNSIQPYVHMNENCGATPPQYIRHPAGC